MFNQKTTYVVAVFGLFGTWVEILVIGNVKTDVLTLSSNREHSEINDCLEDNRGNY